jgi:predicted ATPase
MIKNIVLSNFKCFQAETSFDFGKINLLTGINGRGKSTLLQSMLLFKQSLEHNENAQNLILNGNEVTLGKFQDVKHFDSSNRYPISFRFKLEQAPLDLIMELSYQFKESETNDLVLELDQAEIKSSWPFYNFQRAAHSSSVILRKRTEKEVEKEGKEGFKEVWEAFDFDAPQNLLHRFAFLPMEHEGKKVSIRNQGLVFTDFLKIHYTGADRLGPQNYYEKKATSKFLSLDKQGKNLASVLQTARQRMVHEHLYLREQKDNVSFVDSAQTVLSQVGNWLSYITDTSKISVELDYDANTYIASLSFVFNGKTFKPANVGFGYSYILPIVVSGLIAQPGEIIIVENPEAHLHPRAQSRLANFLAKVASTGVQVFIESHSEHILNSLRVGILDDETLINAEDIAIFYFDNFTNPPARYKKIEVNEMAKINDWVPGFFDQQEKDLSKIFKLSRGKKS